MSKGYICNICNKTKIVTKEERNFIPDGIKGWLHIETWKRIDLNEMYMESMPNDPIQYNEIDICPECSEKIRNVQRNCMAGSDTKCMFDLVGRFMEG